MISQGMSSNKVMNGKMLRTIRLDPSDALIFAPAAAPGEWAVSGAFLFWDQPVAELGGKARMAFRSGLLGIESFGWSTLAVIVAVQAEEYEAAIERLAARLLSHCGAPDFEAARLAARAEIEFASELAEPAVGTLVAVHRSFENGEIRERFRTLLPGTDAKHGRVFEFLEIPDEEEGVGAPEERVDLAALAQAPSGGPA